MDMYRIQNAMDKDHQSLSFWNSEPFENVQDVFDRILPFHIFQKEPQDSPIPPEIPVDSLLNKADSLLGRYSILLEKLNRDEIQVGKKKAQALLYS